MSAVENEAGKAYIAHVSVSEAKAFNPATDDPGKPETWASLSASAFDEKKHGQHEFFCPCCLDKGDKVRLKKPSGGYYQNILFDVIDPETRDVMKDPQTGDPITESRRYFIPPRFSLYPLQRHSCDLGARLNDLSSIVRQNNGVTLNSAAGAYVVNLNIPAGQTPVNHHRPRINLTQAGDFASSAGAENLSPLRRIHKPHTSPPSTRSQGINHVEALAQMLDSTEFDKGQRAHVILRTGAQGLTLAQAYHGQPVEMYRALFERERSLTREGADNHNQIALFHFKPIGDRKFWTKQEDGSTTVQGQAEQVRDKDGRHFYVSARINFQTETALRAFEQAYRKDKERSFLVFTETATVDLKDFEAKRKKLDSGQSRHETVFVDTVVFNAAQMTPWAPRSPQMTIDFPDLEQTPRQPENDEHAFEM